MLPAGLTGVIDSLTVAPSGKVKECRKLSILLVMSDMGSGSWVALTATFIAVSAVFIYLAQKKIVGWLKPKKVSSVKKQYYK